MEKGEKERKNAMYSKSDNKTGNILKIDTSITRFLYSNTKTNFENKIGNNESSINHNIINNKNYINKNNTFNDKPLKNSEKLVSFNEAKINLQPLKTVRKSFIKKKSNKQERYKEVSFSENQQFISLSKSFVEDLENNKTFGSLYDEIEISDINYKRKNSFSFFKSKNDNNNNLLKKSFILMRKISNSYINLNEEKNKDSTFIDEKEIIGQNIEYLNGKNENYEINQFENKNKINISNISVNLFIKKIAIDNLRTKYNLLFRSFLQQYHIFLSIEIFIEKIINAFYYYKKENSNKYPELINLLNIIVLDKYELMKKNENLMSKLKLFYKEIKDDDFLKNSLKEDTLNVYFILFNESDDFDLNIAKNSINFRRANNFVYLGRNRSLIKIKSKKILLDNIFHKKLYFYIFDFTEEEIAIKLTSISYKLMSQITINELINSNFSKKDKTIRSPNVIKIIQRFDTLNLFIIEDILSYDEPKRRAEAITKWIKVAEECKKLYNYNDTLVINTCFSHYLLKSIDLTWKKVPSSTIKKLNSLRQFCSYNQCYLNIRKEIQNRIGRFYVPYLGILLKEIVNLDETHKYILNNGNINCTKIQKLYIIINQFFSFKNIPFIKPINNNLDILDYLTPKKEEQLELVITKIEPKLIITAGKDLKRKTKTDFDYYMNQ